jgi:hypothetical protein
MQCFRISVCVILWHHMVLECQHSSSPLFLGFGILPFNTHVQYQIDKENGSVETFVHFITVLIINVFFAWRGSCDGLCKNPHWGWEASCIETLLWEAPIDGRPLYVLVVYLPTCSPELNPIKFVFHILTTHIRSFRYRMAGPCNQLVVVEAKKVFDEMDYALILHIFIHCGYS